MFLPTHFERVDDDAALGELTLEPFVTVEPDPPAAGGVATDLDERRSPVGVEDV